MSATGQTVERTLDLGPLEVVVRVPSALAAIIDDRLHDLVVDDAVSERISASAQCSVDSTPDGFVLHDDQVRLRAANPAMALDHLIAWCNARVALEGGTGPCLHAAVIAHPESGHGVVLAAPSGHGKSTLAVRFVQRGWHYATDEAACVGAQGALAAYPKPLTLKTGTRQLLIDDGVDLDQYHPDQTRWYLRPDELGGSVRRGEVRAGLVVVPEHQPGASTTLTPLGPTAATVALGHNAHGTLDPDGHDLLTLATLAERTPCVRLNYGDAADAADRIVELLAAPIVDDERAPRMLDVDRTSVPSPARGPAGRADVVAIELSDGMVLFDPVASQLLGLDPTAGAIWPALDGSQPIDDIAAMLAQHFDAPAERIRDDVEILVARLADHGVLVPDRTSS